MAIRLNPLSVAKGKHFECEMCGKPATLACQYCRVTFYCSQEHQSVDWFGIHEKICQLLGALRTLRPTLGSEDERQRRNLTVQMSQHALIDLCKNEAQKHLVQGQYELAIPGALQSLRFSMEVYGGGRIELVPAYLLLAESNLGLKRYQVAEEFLLYANWSVLKTPDCSNELKSQLYRNFGKLYASQGRFEEALKQLAHDVYYASLESGPEHIDTAGGYFYMADVFLTQGGIEHALALYDKVVDIWYKFLVNLRYRTDENISDYLSEAHIGEAVEMLRSVLQTRKKFLGAQHIATGEAAYALGILRQLIGFEEDARQLHTQALAIYVKQLGEENESTMAIVRALEELNRNAGIISEPLRPESKGVPARINTGEFRKVKPSTSGLGLGEDVKHSQQPRAAEEAQAKAEVDQAIEIAQALHNIEPPAPQKEEKEKETVNITGGAAAEVVTDEVTNATAATEATNATGATGTTEPTSTEAETAPAPAPATETETEAPAPQAAPAADKVVETNKEVVETPAAVEEAAKDSKTAVAVEKPVEAASTESKEKVVETPAVAKSEETAPEPKKEDTSVEKPKEAVTETVAASEKSADIKVAAEPEKPV